MVRQSLRAREPSKNQATDTAPPRLDDEEQTTAPRVGGLHKGNPMDKLQTIKFPDGREIKLTECRREGTSLFGKLPNGVEIELNDGDEMTEEEIMSIKRPN
jgi:hypothetical protein